jgi:AcrR family transcriptional regulator
MTRQRSEDWRKQQIRAAATRCFVRRGFSATRLLDIAKEAGLSKGGVYFHYRAKEALFNDILDAQLKTLESRWAFVPSDDQPAEEVLRRLLLAQLQTLEDEPDETRLNHLLISMAQQDSTFRDKLEEGFRVVRSLYASVIERGIREGSFRAGDPEQLAYAVFGLVQGLACQSATDSAGKLPLAPEAAANCVLRMLCTNEVFARRSKAADRGVAPEAGTRLTHSRPSVEIESQPAQPSRAREPGQA